MREVIRFEANDGSVFLTSEEAIRHDELLAIIAWYNDNKLYGTYGSTEWENVWDWLTRHREKLNEILSVIDYQN